MVTAIESQGGLSTSIPSWSWASYKRRAREEARARAGVGRDGRFNAGSMPFPATTTVGWDTATGERRVINAAENDDLVARIARSLHELGVRRGDCVAGFLARRPASLAMPLAVWRLGAIYVPLFTSLGVDAIKVRMEDSGAQCVVTDTVNRVRFGEVEGLLPPIRVLVVDGRGHDGDASLAKYGFDLGGRNEAR